MAGSYPSPAFAVLKYTTTTNGNAYDARIVASGGGIYGYSGQGVLTYTAAQHNFATYDGAIQFRAGDGPGAVEFVSAIGGLSGQGATLLADSDVSTDIDLSLVARGTGDLYLSNGSGPIMQLADRGAATTVPLLVRGGAGSGSNPGIYTAATSVEVGAPYASSVNFVVNGDIVGSAAGTGSDAMVNYLQMQGTNLANGYGIMQSISTASNAGMFFRSKGHGDFVMACQFGNLLQCSHDTLSGSIINNLKIFAYPTGVNPRIQSNGEAGRGIDFAGNTTVGLIARITAPATAAANYVEITATTTGLPALLTFTGSDTNVDATISAKGTGTITISSPTKFTSATGAGAPTTTNIPAGRAQVWKNSGDGTVKLYYNDAGTLKSVTLT